MAPPGLLKRPGPAPASGGRLLKENMEIARPQPKSKAMGKPTPPVSSVTGEPITRGIDRRFPLDDLDILGKICKVLAHVPG